MKGGLLEGKEEEEEGGFGEDFFVGVLDGDVFFFFPLFIGLVRGRGEWRLMGGWVGGYDDRS